ncbi:hypothetical protein QCA50_018306 [Cerrena zonata]|uniref:Uncharacterized protein n=1 Tax=Cerrena zonata TaxID=2478898 RepID=A0AAW0FIC0_9APHY
MMGRATGHSQHLQSDIHTGTRWTATAPDALVFSMDEFVSGPLSALSMVTNSDFHRSQHYATLLLCIDAFHIKKVSASGSPVWPRLTGPSIFSNLTR